MPLIAHLSAKKVFLYLFILDVLIILLHLTFGSVSSFFHLDFEHNVPTVYQAVKLLTASYLLIFGILEISSKKLNATERWLLYPMAGIFLFLGLDELGLLHEQLDHYIREVFPQFADGVLWQAQQLGYFSSTWMLYYSPLILLAGIYCIFAARFVLKFQPKTIVLLLLFGGLLASTLCFEFIANQNQVLPEQYQLFALLEESSELFGITAGVVFVIKLFQNLLRIDLKS